jgi:hypothetical protein
MKGPAVLLQNNLAEYAGNSIKALGRGGAGRQSPYQSSGAWSVEGVSVVLLTQPKEELEFKDSII